MAAGQEPDLAGAAPSAAASPLAPASGAPSRAQEQSPQPSPPARAGASRTPLIGGLQAASA
jgi:hypothetical protein